VGRARAKSLARMRRSAAGVHGDRQCEEKGTTEVYVEQRARWEDRAYGARTGLRPLGDGRDELDPESQMARPNPLATRSTAACPGPDCAGIILIPFPGNARKPVSAGAVQSLATSIATR